MMFRESLLCMLILAVYGVACHRSDMSLINTEEEDISKSFEEITTNMTKEEILYPKLIEIMKRNQRPTTNEILVCHA